MNYPSLAELAYVVGPPMVGAVMRSAPEDFVVEEHLSFVPAGKGEHVLLQIRKRNTNTEWLARHLSQFAGVPPVDIGYAGLKDRNAVTTQWFSVRLAKRAVPDWHLLNNADIQVLQVLRHDRKLRRGALRANHFTLVLRHLEGERGDLNLRMSQIATYGVPNYFGPQRFGQGEANLEQAAALFAGTRPVRNRHKRGIYLSAARSFLFNCVLSRRVADGTWNQPLPGDVMQLDGARSVFQVDQPDAEILQRLGAGDIHPTGPLWGRGPSLARHQAAALEDSVLAAYPEFRAGLEAAGLEQERRPLRLFLKDRRCEFLPGDGLRLEFLLPPGAYATTVLRELLQVREAAPETTAE